MIFARSCQKGLVNLSATDGVLSNFFARYVKDRVYLWHLRFCGLVSVLMGILLSPGVMSWLNAILPFDKPSP